MKKLISITKTNKKGKKYKAIFEEQKGGNTRKYIRYFGAAGYSDYTKHKDKERRRLYRARHKGFLKSDKTSPAYLSYYILWGPYTSIKKNIAYYKNKFNL